MKRLALLLVLSFTSLVQADEIAVILPDTPKSYLVTVDAQGVASVVPLKSMVRPGPAPPPVPPNPPPPPVMTERAKAFQAAAAKVTGDPDRTGTARGLAELDRRITALIRDGTIKDINSLMVAVGTADNTFLSSRNVSTQWQAVRDLRGSYWTVLAQKNAPLSDPTGKTDSYAALLDDYSAGIDASVPERGITITPEMMAFIIQIIQLILSLIKH